jgi:hypothetical protein
MEEEQGVSQVAYTTLINNTHLSTLPSRRHAVRCATTPLPLPPINPLARPPNTTRTFTSIPLLLQIMSSLLWLRPSPIFIPRKWRRRYGFRKDD